MLAISMIPYIIIHLISEIVFCTVHSRFKNLSKILQNTKVTKRFRVKKQKEIRVELKIPPILTFTRPFESTRYNSGDGILCFHACIGYIAFSGFTLLFALLKVLFLF